MFANNNNYTLMEYKVCLQSVLLCWVSSFWMLPLGFALWLSLGTWLRGCSEVSRMLEVIRSSLRRLYPNEWLKTLFRRLGFESSNWCFGFRGYVLMYSYSSKVREETICFHASRVSKILLKFIWKAIPSNWQKVRLNVTNVWFARMAFLSQLT